MKSTASAEVRNLCREKHTVWRTKVRSTTVSQSIGPSIIRFPLTVSYIGVKFHYGALSDVGFVNQVVAAIRPDEIYNLGANSHVGTSWELAGSTCETNAMGVVYLLEALRACGATLKTRFFQVKLLT